MDRPTCATCAYYDEPMALCCRRPVSEDKCIDDWCGEHHLFDRYVKFVTTKQDNDAYEARRELMQERAKFVPEVDIKAFMRP